jgi:alanyl-tRNA synthetase
LTVGDKVHVEVDWTRRWDHMQQHSGQHLISAYLENNHDLKTLSWSMGTMVSTVDVAVSDAALLNRPEQELLAQWEQDLNELIRQDKRVVTHSYAREQQGEEHSRRGLPKDYTGTVVRVIEIDGVDKNACCGTHINRLGELQVITFPRMDVLKNQTVIRVHFLVGTSRVLSTFHGMVEREKDMTALLDTRPQDHVSKATLVLTAKRELEKDKKRLRQDVAMSIADRLIAQMAARDRVGWYREDFDLDFMTTVIHCCRDKHDISKHVITLAGGALKTGGPVMILGTESELVEQSIIMVKQLGDGVKGGGKGGRWMGKSTQWHSAVNDLLT